MFDNDPFYTVLFTSPTWVEAGRFCCLKEQAFRQNLICLGLVIRGLVLTVAGAEAG
jgi:hypothetical protein